MTPEKLLSLVKAATSVGRHLTRISYLSLLLLMAKRHTVGFACLVRVVKGCRRS